MTRVLLVPSLFLEWLGRVAVEGMANGIPVLASDRGALPETLGEAGFVFTVPEQYTPSSIEVPTAREVVPWVATIERLWDDQAWESAHQALAPEAVARFALDRVVPQYLTFFGSLARDG
jgi:glycosyltransferase involved in cell wall biosynthesis